MTEPAEHLRTLAPTVRPHYCTPGCLSPCDIKQVHVWYHEENVRYTAAEMEQAEKDIAEWLDRMRREGRLP